MPPRQRLEHYFQNAPDSLLTLLLLGLAGTIVYIALQPDKPLLKAFVAAWVILP